MRKTCARLVLLGAALVGLASSAGSARADVVFSQAPNFAFMSSKAAWANLLVKKVFMDSGVRG